ncbi:MAG: hypothetical protein M1836_006600 [Candelina mexicana]|nr:MAG: hypothetical protein M1836_006600 [Candelina mexicana]
MYPFPGTANSYPYPPSPASLYPPPSSSSYSYPSPFLPPQPPPSSYPYPYPPSSLPPPPSPSFPYSYPSSYPPPSPSPSFPYSYPPSYPPAPPPPLPAPLIPQPQPTQFGDPQPPRISNQAQQSRQTQSSWQSLQVGHPQPQRIRGAEDLRRNQTQPFQQIPPTQSSWQSSQIGHQQSRRIRGAGDLRRSKDRSARHKAQLNNALVSQFKSSTSIGQAISTSELSSKPPTLHQSIPASSLTPSHASSKIFMEPTDQSPPQPPLASVSSTIDQNGFSGFSVESEIPAPPDNLATYWPFDDLVDWMQPIDQSPPQPPPACVSSFQMMQTPSSPPPTINQNEFSGFSVQSETPAPPDIPATSQSFDVPMGWMRSIDQSPLQSSLASVSSQNTQTSFRPSSTIDQNELSAFLEESEIPAPPDIPAASQSFDDSMEQAGSDSTSDRSGSQVGLSESETRESTLNLQTPKPSYPGCDPVSRTSEVETDETFVPHSGVDEDGIRIENYSAWRTCENTLITRAAKSAKYRDRIKDIGLLFPHRSIGSIKRRVRTLGLYRKTRHLWSKKEDEVLKSAIEQGVEVTKMSSLLPDRSVDAIRHRHISMSRSLGHPSSNRVIQARRAAQSITPSVETPAAQSITPSVETPAAQSITPPVETPAAQPITPSVETPAAQFITPLVETPAAQPIKPSVETPAAHETVSTTANTAKLGLLAIVTRKSGSYFSAEAVRNGHESNSLIKTRFLKYFEDDTPPSRYLSFSTVRSAQRPIPDVHVQDIIRGIQACRADLKSVILLRGYDAWSVNVSSIFAFLNALQVAGQLGKVFFMIFESGKSNACPPFAKEGPHPHSYYVVSASSLKGQLENTWDEEESRTLIEYWSTASDARDLVGQAHGYLNRGRNRV